ncbi:hypothetical protein HSBGL_0116 [Halapricum desulfuricans]|uniref:Uncharacterized protein n=1 Tax=Halapricum desulfuricans TaxID=2841257 RepID=A0A897NDG9_9EURY|nr:hypothetical protein [Halapricum desulfuricans]QSG10558.1 hypothetical protein HSBGL_0116 [Halapricum desulfuricans]
MTPERSDSESDTGVSRRKFVAGGAAGWASVALAGCNALSPGDDTDTEEPTETETPEPQPENYVVTDDILVGSAGNNPAGAGGFADSCSWTRTFTHGMEPVFKVGVYDPSGEQLGSDEISVAINIDGGPTEDLAWGGDAEEDPVEEWSGPVWEQIPDDWPTGETTYTVEVTDNDGNFTSVGIASGVFEVVEYDDPGNSYVVTAETYHTSTLGDAGSDSQFISSCNPNYTFDSTGSVGFDIGIWHASSGEMVTPSDEIVDSAQITFPSDEIDTTLELAWGAENNDSWSEGSHAWNAVWKADSIPDDLSGEYAYEVQISGTNGDEEFNDVGVYLGSIYFVNPNASSDDGSS